MLFSTNPNKCSTRARVLDFSLLLAFCSSVKGLLPTIEKLILKQGKINFLITEGTMLSRLDERVRYENELKKEAVEQMKHYKNVFVMCSSTDMEIVYIEELLSVKGRVKEIFDIDYYLKNKDELTNLLGM